MEVINKYDKYRFKIVSVESIKKEKNEKSNLKKCNQDMATANGKIRNDLNKSNERIKDLEDEIELIKKDRLDVAAKCDTERLEKKEIEEKYKSKVSSLEVRLTKAVSKLNNKIDRLQKMIASKDKEIEKLHMTISEIEAKNHVQAVKIKELTDNKHHSLEEYKHNGLSKSTKKVLSKTKNN